MGEFVVHTDIALWLVAAVAVLLYWLAMVGELAFPTAGRSEMRALDGAGNPVGSPNGVSNSSASRLSYHQVSAAEQLMEDPGRFLTGMMVLKTLALVLLGIAVARLMATNTGIWSVLGLALGLILLVLVAGAMLRGWILNRSALLAVRLARPLQIVMFILAPLIFMVRTIGKRNRPNEEEQLPDDVLLSENGLRLLMGIGSEDSSILESEKEMIASILEMDDTAAKEVMVPRMDMVALNVETPLADALDVIMEVGHSRIPLYEDNVDRIVGMLYAKDLLRCYRENRDDVTIRSMMRPAHFVPVSKKVNVLLRDMQKHRVHIVMVVDEYGGTAGLVTIEDILEEIVGDIQDEYDMGEEEYIEAVGPDAYVLNSRLDLYSLSKLLDIELDDEDADTLGGLIYSLLGHVPAQGETIDVSGWQFTVLGIDGNRIDRVRADRRREIDESDEAAADVKADAQADVEEATTTGSLNSRSAHASKLDSEAFEGSPGEADVTHVFEGHPRRVGAVEAKRE